MKRQLIAWNPATTSFKKATNGIGRERILLSLYLENEGRNDATWLPKFDDSIAESILGTSGRNWHPARRTLATQLFFTHFERLPALELLSRRLNEAYETVAASSPAIIKIRQHYRTTIFTTDGPEKIVEAAAINETLTDLMDRFTVPKEIGGVQLTGQFAAKLKECFLLARLNAVELGGGQEILHELETMRHVPYQSGIPMGAAAVRILTQRTLLAGGLWQGDWADWLLRLGSDPSIPNSAEFLKWWACWHPMPAELECARRGVNRQTLEYFIQFLDASLREEGRYDQFKDRAGFLRWLDDTRKILRFKLLLHPRAFEDLPSAYRQQRHRVAQIEGTGQRTSVIVIECIDEVWIAEGTHSFAIRAFRQEFPVPEVFLEDRHSYLYSTFTQGAMHRYSCTGIWKAHMGDWISDLLWQMKWKFHIEPPWRYR